MQIGFHIALFFMLAIPIVVLGAFYADQDDRAAFAAVPKRLAVFVLSCALLTVVMLFCEHTFAAVS